MGREIALLWPEILRSQDARNGYLLDQFAARTWWDGDLSALDDHRAPILGQVSLGSLTTDLFRRLGVSPDAAIGYSMGESAALVSLGAWTDRDEMTRRLMASPLFATELAGTCEAARRSWNLQPGEPVDWVAGIVPCSSARVERAIGDTPRVYVLIINSAEETLIGGRRREVRGCCECTGMLVRRAADRQHGPLRDRPMRRDRVSRTARPTHQHAGWHHVLQRRLGAALPARSIDRGRRDHRAGYRKDRLSRRDRESLCRRGSRFPGNGSRGFLHTAD